MSQLKTIIVSALMVLISGCAINIAKVNFDKNTEIDTSSYKTFAWLNQEKIMAPATDINPVMKVRVDKSIEQAFLKKGYLLVTDAEQADFTLSYTLGDRDKIQVDSYPTTYRSPFSWGRHYFGFMYKTPDTTVRQYIEGKLAIDIYDVKTRQPVWHGWAIKRIKSKEQGFPPEKVDAIVSQVVNQFNSY